MKIRRKMAIFFAVSLTAAQLTGCGRYEPVETAVTAAAAQEGNSDTTAPETERLSVENVLENEVPEETGTAKPPVAAEADRESGGDQAGVSDQQFLDNTGMGKEEAAAFVSSFLAVVKADDREAVAAMIAYPRKVKTPDGEGTVNHAGEFLAYYDGIFTETFKEKLESLSAGDLFTDNGMIGVGDGCLWFYPATVETDMCVGTINAAEDRYVRYGGPSGVQPG